MVKAIASKDILDLLSRHFDFDARCLADAVALSVLGDISSFPDDHRIAKECLKTSKEGSLGEASKAFDMLDSSVYRYAVARHEFPAVPASG